MAITATSLAGALSATDLAAYTTGTLAATDATPVYMSVHNRVASGTANEPTVTGTNLTWVSVGTVLNSGNRRLTVFRSMATGSITPEVAVIDFALQTQTQCSWSVNEYPGSDSSGTNGSGSFVQVGSVGSGSGTSYTVTLSALGSTSNAVFAACYHFANEAVTPGTDWTELHELATAENTSVHQTQWKINDNVATATWASSVDRLGIAVEIKAAASAFNVKPTMFGVF